MSKIFKVHKYLPMRKKRLRVYRCFAQSEMMSKHLLYHSSALSQNLYRNSLLTICRWGEKLNRNSSRVGVGADFFSLSLRELKV